MNAGFAGYVEEIMRIDEKYGTGRHIKPKNKKERNKRGQRKNEIGEIQ
tara:strand:- start:364 stop:507 length:144 start_codon:yes stop_codon:yes gene_type:complete